LSSGSHQNFMILGGGTHKKCTGQKKNCHVHICFQYDEMLQPENCSIILVENHDNENTNEEIATESSFFSMSGGAAILSKERKKVLV